MSINQAYTKDIKDNLNYTATWLPNVGLSLGDIGILSNYEFIYQTNLNNLGIGFQESPPGASVDYSHMSSDAVTRTLKLAGKAPLPGSVLTKADAGISFTFSRKHAIVFLANDCTITTILDQAVLKQAILRAYDSGQWERDYVVVTELVSAGSTSLIISEGSQARYELKGKGGITPTFETMGVQGNFSLAHDSQIGFNCIARPGMTPLFRCLGLRFGMLRRDVSTRTDIVSGDPRSVGTGPDKPAVMVSEVEYEDYLGLPIHESGVAPGT